MCRNFRCAQFARNRTVSQGREAEAYPRAIAIGTAVITNPYIIGRLCLKTGEDLEGIRNVRKEAIAFRNLRQLVDLAVEQLEVCVQIILCRYPSNGSCIACQRSTVYSQTARCNIAGDGSEGRFVLAPRAKAIQTAVCTYICIVGLISQQTINDSRIRRYVNDSCCINRIRVEGCNRIYYDLPCILALCTVHPAQCSRMSGLSVTFRSSRFQTGRNRTDYYIINTQVIVIR